MLLGVQVRKNAIPQKFIDTFIDIYNRNEKSGDGMRKVVTNCVEDPEFLKPIKEAIGSKNVLLNSSNFYQTDENNLYWPHTDYHKSTNSEIENPANVNVNVPLKYEGDEIPHLVIFNQRYLKYSVTWCLDDPVYEFTYNKGVPGRPYDYDITNKTEKEIDEQLYNEHLSKHGPARNFYGLSGKAYALYPGSFIAFDNKRIHCTSNKAGPKLGLNLTFNT